MPKTSFQNFIIFAIAVTAFKLLFLAANSFPLWVDEAQYWTWSKQLDFGYYSKPPIVAWLIYISTSLFGDGLFGIRFFSPILHLITAIFVYKSTKNLTEDEQSANAPVVAGLIYLLMPIVSFSGYLISADVPLIMFWAIAFYYFTKILKDPSLKNWLMVGVFAGLSMMSKYTAIFFCFSLFLYCLLNRKEFFKANPYVSALAFLVVFSGNLIWNYNHEFISFVHTGENVLEQSSSLKFDDFFEFLGAQILIFNPIFFAILLITIFKKDDQNKSPKESYFKKYIYLHIFTLPPIIAGLVIALKSGAQAHWAACAYVTASITVAMYICEFNKSKIYKIGKYLNIFLLVALTLILYAFYYLNPNIPAVKRVIKWYDVAISYVELYVKNPDAKLVADERKVIAPAIHFFTNLDEPLKIEKLSFAERPYDYYDMKYKHKIIEGEKLILITRMTPKQALEAKFRKVKEIKSSAPKGFTAYILEK